MLTHSQAYLKLSIYFSSLLATLIRKDSLGPTLDTLSVCDLSIVGHEYRWNKIRVLIRTLRETRKFPVLPTTNATVPDRDSNTEAQPQ